MNVSGPTATTKTVPNGDGLRARLLTSWGLLVAIALTGLVIATGVYVIARDIDTARIRTVLEVRATSRVGTFERALMLSAARAVRLANYIAAEGDVGAARFATYTKLAAAGDIFDSAIYWSPIVAADQRAAFVARARADGDPDYDIRDIDANDRFVSAATRDVYLPQRYEYTYDGTPGVNGFDLMFRPARRAEIERVRDTGKPLATSPFQMLMGGQRVPGFLILWPVFGPAGVPAAVEQRRAEFRGVVTARIRFDRFLKAALVDQSKVIAAIEIAIGADADHAQPVAWIDPVTQDFTLGAMTDPMANAVTSHRTFTALGQTWVLAFHFPPAVTGPLSSSAPFAGVAFCILLTLVVMIAAERERWRRAGVEALVTERTASLGETNRALWIEIGERTEAEFGATRLAEKLAHRERQLRAVLDGTVDGIVTIDEFGTILTVTNRTQRMFGYGADEIVGQNIKMLVPDSMPDGTGEKMIQGRRKDGSKFPIDFGISEIGDNEGQREFVASIRDITDQVAAEAENRNTQALLQATFDAAPYAIVVRDADLNVLFWNRTAQTVFGISAAELQEGRPLQEMVERVTAGEAIVSIERARHQPDGSTIHLRGTLAPIHRDGKITAFVGIVEDVTERIQREQQLVHIQRMEAIGELSGGMAHDFNNLLAVVVGNLDMLISSLAKGSVDAEMAQSALESALHGADLTNSLLAFARRQPLKPQTIDVNALVANTARMLGRLLDGNIRLSLDLADETASTLVDPVQLESSLLNLATNARDAMPQGGTITIATGNRTLDFDYCAAHPDATPGDYALVEVTDTGIGMTEETMSHMYEPFYTTKELGKGTGLGLSMVFGFVKQSGGHVSVVSQPGAGSTFRLYFQRAAQPAADAVAPAPSALPRAQGEVVLIVEDNEKLRRVVVRQIAALGYRTLDVDDADAALEILNSQKIDLLFSDIVMPGTMDGFALAARVAETWPTIKVVLTSGFPGSGASRAMLESAPRLLTKPYRLDDLAHALRAALDG